MNFSDNLKRLRKENNLSQEELAEKLGVSRQSVSKWESNVAYPEMDKIIQISNMFNIGIDELLNKDIKEVQEEKQSKNSINKHIDDFFSFITKSIDMFLNMKTKQKIKFIFEQCCVAFILLILFSLFGGILSTIVQHALRFIEWKILSYIMSFLESIYTILALCFGVIILLHIYKTRYLDYYVIVDKEDIEEKQDIDNESNSDSDNVAKKEFIQNSREKVNIRDLDHSSYRFISGLLKAFLILIKINAAFIFLGACFCLVGFAIALVFTFAVIKTGMFFIGLLLSALACITITIICMDILFNFIISRKSKLKLLFVVFISSLIVLGSGIGLAFLGFSEFNFVTDNIKTYEEVIPMRDDLIIHGMGSHVNYIEDINSDIRIEVKCSNYDDVNIELDNEFVDIYLSSDNYNSLEVIREELKHLNNKEIRNLDYFEINVYTTKENIDKLKNNINNWYYDDFE